MDNDLNTVKPVDVSGRLSPTAGTDKKRQNKQKQRWKERTKNQDEPASLENQDQSEAAGKNNHQIDYRA